MTARVHLTVTGVVQGVGFRPTLHRLAEEYAFSGWCQNTVDGVELEAQGESNTLSALPRLILENAPPLSRIDHIRMDTVEPREGEGGFSILQSPPPGQGRALVSPDTATCADCRRELFDPKDRRFRHPFVNCTNCGPRFSILKRLPYDRDNTAMAPFPMCPVCRREYEDIASRRYHAQPNCCPHCGPKLGFWDRAGEQPGDPIANAVRLLQQGGIVAVKGLGGYHLACRADAPDTVAELRRRKRRDERPFALMCRNLTAAQRYCYVNPQEQKMLTSPAAPIVLLQKRRDCPKGLSETGELGIMLPYTPIHHLLMEQFDLLVMTSMNHSDRPVLCEIQGEEWKTLADGLLTHHRAIVNRCDDSLLRMNGEHPLFFRRSRGFAPQPVTVNADCTGILALGAEQKAAFAFGRGQEVFVSQHLGDLKDFETEQFYTDQIARFQGQFGLEGKALVCDLHPDYRSTAYAEERSRREGLPLLHVQHHHAHMVACMGDNRLTGGCIGVIWDGTGYGTDGTIWGGECLAGDESGFHRLGSIWPIPLPGGDRCATEIGRIAHVLRRMAGRESGHPQGAALDRLMHHAPRSSGMGRLFDGVYAMLTGRDTVTYEGQGAVLLEAMAAQDVEEGYPLPVLVEQQRLTLDTGALAGQILDDPSPAPVRAARFMNTLMALAVEQAKYARQRTGFHRVMLSGGVFQNRYLTERLPIALKEAGLEPYTHKRVAPNDQGIVLGQMLIAQRALKSRHEG